MAAAGSRSLLLAVTLLLGGGVSFCAQPKRAAQGGAASGSTSGPDPVAVLRDWENATRQTHDFAYAPTSDTALGTDPYVIRSASPYILGEPPRFVGILRGRAPWSRSTPT